MLSNDVRLDLKAQESPDDRRGLVNWIKDHKRQLILAGLSVTTLLAIAIGLKNKETIKDFWKSLVKSIEKYTSSPYSNRWFEKATDNELSIEREKIRLEFCSSGDDLENAILLENLLIRFDKEMSRREWGDEVPRAPSIHREHGWYLPNDD